MGELIRVLLNGELGSGSSNDDNTRFNRPTRDGNNGLRGQNQVHDSVQISQQPPQGPVICWERFLPVRSIKVLLVEDDDSTRHVVRALLRNCSYEVTAVSNGLQAWKILEDPGNHIDLVLTEVAIPILSGIGLLCKIMNHKTLKNIPVIMMSSHDSMGIAFKCLSKGAVDFLVKPIRRNELRNLWQHVWRRCHSSSGSGSESGTHNRKSAKTRSNDASENNSDSSDENDCGSRDLTVRDGSDNGSGTQSSWTKCLVQVGSSHPVSPHKQLVDAPDSTCAEVMHTKPEKASSRWMHATEKECRELVDHLDNVAMGKDLAMGITSNVQPEHPPKELSSNPSGKGIDIMSDVDGKHPNKGHSNVCEKGQLDFNSDKNKPQENQAMNVVDVTDSSSPQAESRDLNTPNGFSGFSQTKASCSFKQHPSLELTLKRLGETRDAKIVTSDECNILRHSDLSAFSKYNTASSANQSSRGLMWFSLYSPIICVRYDEQLCLTNKDTPPNQQSNGSNNTNDMASTNACLGTKPETLDKKLESARGIGSFNSSGLQNVQHNGISSSQKKISAQGEYAEIVKGQVECSEQGLQLQQNHYQIHHYNHIAHKAALDLRSGHDDPSMKGSSKAAQQCVSSNVFGGPAESNAANFGIDGNAVESDHGSNGQDACSNTLTVRTMNVENGNVASGSNGGDLCSLQNFQFEYKNLVRYHSRKKLAEQRPRIRGQFVRRIASDPKTEKHIQSNNMDSSDAPQ
ncbi:hypothetical protein PIB30_051417 [Stylosanthes scabra]|uniref:Uncharacterized protein n=1 Tax=Stylosanthes scabra TaxID=79078 RepID=A0ABU6XGF6_9FABA|nr:hypothetical protein [Stylosanthes scabra]